MNRKLERKNMVLYIAGRLMSLLGTYIYQFAAGFYVLKMTGSGMQFAMTLASGTLPRLILAPIAGVVADRMSRKAVVIGMDFLSGASQIAIVILAGTKIISVEMVYVSIVILTACNTFFDVAMESAKPGLAPADSLEKFNAVSFGVQHLTAIAGPVLGGMVFGFADFKVFILINGLSFIVSGFLELGIDFKCGGHDSSTSQASSEGITKALMGGIEYLKGDRFALSLMAFSVTVNFCLTLSVSVPLPYLYTTVLGMSSTWVGFVSSGFPVGYLVGAALITIHPLRDKGRTLRLSVIGIGLGLAGLTLQMYVRASLSGVTNAAVSSLILAFVGGAVAFLDIPVMTFMQNEIPGYVRGRVFSLMMMASRLATPAAMMISGQALHSVSVIWLLLAGTAVYSLALVQILRSSYVDIYSDKWDKRLSVRAAK